MEPTSKDNPEQQSPATVSTADSKPPAKGKKKLLIISLILLIVLVVVGGAGYYATHNPKNSADVTYSTSSLNTYKLRGFIKGAGMTFQKPKELVAAYPLPHNQDSMQFVDDKTLTTGKIITLSYMYANSQYNVTQAPRTQDMIDAINKTMTDPSDSSYSSNRQSLTKFVEGFTNKRWQVTLEASQKSSNANYGVAAWTTTFTGVDNNPTSVYTPTKLQGEFIYSIGKNAEYYFLAASVNGNWQNNLAVWQQVMDSLKVDQ